MGQLEGRIALVTGGGRGIGRAISELLAAEGAAVGVNYRRDAEAAAATVETIRSAGGTAIAVQGSVDDADACAAAVETVVSELGGLDILVCNAGIASRGNSVVDTDPAEMMRVVATHAFGPHHLARLAIPHIRKHRRGDIVMISSVAPQHNRANGAPYNMGKAAMESLAYTLANEERANGIHVNVVAPGLVETDMGVRLARSFTGNRALQDLRSLDAASPFGRTCQPIDVANAVLWLCSENASYITGQRIVCNGGG